MINKNSDSILPSNFDPKIYRELNKDLINLSDLECTRHYIYTGIIENRIYSIPQDFDPKIYRELYKDLNNLSVLECKRHYAYTGILENRIYKYEQKNMDFNVYIYCCGKSGSSTLTNTFNNNSYNALHLHGIKDYLRLPECKINNNVFGLIEKSMINNDKVYIIDSYRNPIERKLSSFFQVYKENNYEIDYITKKIDECILEIENYSSINEVLDYFNLPYFTEFDFKNKYNILYYKNVVIIKLRFEDINEWGDILSSIFGKPIKMYSDNLSENKNYINEYNIIKKHYNVSLKLIEQIKNNTEFKIYNTNENQEKYLKYWSQRTK
jgi:hypothetical protein